LKHSHLAIKLQLQLCKLDVHTWYANVMRIIKSTNAYNEPKSEEFTVNAQIDIAYSTHTPIILNIAKHMYFSRFFYHI